MVSLMTILLTLAVKDTTGDVQNTYKSTDHAIVASTGIPTHKIGPFAATDLDPGNQRYLKRIPLTPTVKVQKKLILLLDK